MLDMMTLRVVIESVVSLKKVPGKNKVIYRKFQKKKKTTTTRTFSPGVTITEIIEPGLEAGVKKKKNVWFRY